VSQEVNPEKKGGGLQEKAQLHADSLAHPRYELEGEGCPESVSELPALEPTGSELEGRKTNSLREALLGSV